MELEVKFIDGSTVIYKKDEWLKATFENGFFYVKDGAIPVLCAPDKNVLYYKINYGRVNYERK